MDNIYPIPLYFFEINAIKYKVIQSNPSYLVLYLTSKFRDDRPPYSVRLYLNSFSCVSSDCAFSCVSIFFLVMSHSQYLKMKDMWLSGYYLSHIPERVGDRIDVSNHFNRERICSTTRPIRCRNGDHQWEITNNENSHLEASDFCIYN